MDIILQGLVLMGFGMGFVFLFLLVLVGVTLVSMKVIAKFDSILPQEAPKKKLILWSTSRNKLWFKGETSGETFDLLEAYVNCEQNSLLYVVRPCRGGICHTKNNAGQPRNCYYRKIDFDTLKLTFVDP